MLWRCFTGIPTSVGGSRQSYVWSKESNLDRPTFLPYVRTFVAHNIWLAPPHTGEVISSNTYHKQHQQKEKTMMKIPSILSAVLLFSTTVEVVQAATRIAVLEVGAGGVVHQAQDNVLSPQTTTEGVASFFSALHGYGRKLQHAGMAVVPDLFARPSSGIVIGLTSSNGMDVERDMPTIHSWMTDEDSTMVVGSMEVPGRTPSGEAIMKRITNVETVEDSSSLRQTCHKHAHESGLSGVSIPVTSSTASSVDEQLAAWVTALAASMEDSDETVVVHIVVDEEEGSARRRHLARRLEDGGDNENQDEGDQDNQNDNQDNNADGDNNNADAQQDGSYYGYYDANGVWVTTYKTIFQIQYFNLVLWTSVGLVATLFFAVYLMVYMPLMADTLLFGEQARSSLDD